MSKRRAALFNISRGSPPTGLFFTLTLLLIALHVAGVKKALELIVGCVSRSQREVNKENEIMMQKKNQAVKPPSGEDEHKHNKTLRDLET